MLDLNEDQADNVRHIAIGPGRHRRTGSPVVEAYADGAIDRQCTNCGADPLQFCRHANGAPRKVPCISRLVRLT